MRPPHRKRRLAAALAALAAACGLMAWLGLRTVPGTTTDGTPGAAGGAGGAATRGGADAGGATAAGATDADGVAPGCGTVSGRVVGPDGTGLGGAEIRVVRGRESVGATCADDGTFRIGPVPAGSGWTLRVAGMRGLAAAAVALDAVHDRRTLDAGTVVLAAEHAIRGRVVDVRERPIADARVAAYASEGFFDGIDVIRTLRGLRSPPTPDLETRTADDGSFLLAARPGTWLLVAERRPEFAAATAEVSVSDAVAPPVRIALVAGRRVTGQVVLPPAADPAGVRVVLVPEFQDLAPRASLASGVSAEVGPDGRFEIDGVPARAWTAAVVGPAWIAVDARRSATGGGPLRIAPPAASWLRGRVIGPDDSPVGGACVCVVDGWMLAAWTAADGTYLVPVGTVGRQDFVGVRAAGFAPHPDLFPVRSREMPSLVAGENVYDVRLAASGTLRGIVVARSGGAPIAGATVRAVSGYTIFGGAPSSVTGPDGRFEIRDVPREAATVLATCPGWAQPGASAVLRSAVDVSDATAPSGDDVRIEMDPAPVVRGRVVGPDGAGVPGATVRARSAADDMEVVPCAAAEETVAAGADGSFAVTLALATESVQLTAAAPGWHAAGAEAEAPFTSDVTLVLARGTIVEGRVVGEDGAPIAGADVAARPDEGEGRRWATAVRVIATDADGAFRFDDLPPGSWSLRAAEPHHLFAVREVATRGEPVRADFTLLPAMVVAGTVRLPDGTPASAARVHLRRDEDERAATTGADGRFSIDGVPPGAWELVAEREGVAPSEPMAVTGELTEADVRLVARRSLAGRLRWEGGAPAAGLDVIAWRGSEEAGRAVSSPTGTWEIPHLASGVYVITVRSGDGNRADRRTVGPTTARAGTDDVDLAVFVGAVVRGTVVHDDGSPAAGVAIECEAAGSAPDDVAESERPLLVHSRAVTTSDGDGAFAFERLVPGRWRLTASGCAAATAVVDSDVKQVSLRLCPGCTLRGRVLRADGSPAARRTVKVEMQVDPGRSPVSATTDGDGRFVLGPLPCGPVVVQASVESLEWFGIRCTAEHGDATPELTLRERPGNGR